MTRKATAGMALSIEDLWVSIGTGPRRTDVIRGLDLELPASSTVGLLGPSGAGKTITALSILGLLPGGRDSIRRGSIRLGELELTTLSEDGYRRLRGREIAIVFQDPGVALTPVLRIGALLAETLETHFDLGKGEAGDRTRRLLTEVGFRDPDKAAVSFVHELSGGMRQRAMIALALAGEPSVLIADEPTSALDAIAQDEILGLLESIRDRRRISILLISHDSHVIERMADRTVTIEAGQVTGSRSLDPPSPAETRLTPRTRRPSTPALELRNVSAGYGPDEPALNDVSLELRRGEILGLVGESGSGKTTLARCALRLIEPAEGQILLDGTDLLPLSRRALRRLRPQISAVFQNPGSSLNPARTIARILEAPLVAHRIGGKTDRRRRIGETLESVELDPGILGRRPDELSGGQQQRVALARALVTDPQVLICDEPFTALDLPLREQLTRLLLGLQDRRRLACLFIAHDLDAVGRIADRVGVMKDGRIVEVGPTASVLTDPAQPITRRLVEASRVRG